MRPRSRLGRAGFSTCGVMVPGNDCGSVTSGTQCAARTMYISAFAMFRDDRGESSSLSLSSGTSSHFCERSCIGIFDDGQGRRKLTTSTSRFGDKYRFLATGSTCSRTWCTASVWMRAVACVCRFLRVFTSRGGGGVVGSSPDTAAKLAPVSCASQSAESACEGTRSQSHSNSTL